MIDLRPRERTTDAVRCDRWDAADFEQAVEDFPRMAELQERLADVNKVGEDIVRDLFLSTFKHDPRLNDRGDVEHSHVINHAVMEELQKTQEWSKLREFTQADPCGAAIASMGLTELVTKLYGKLSHLQEAGDAAQAAQDALDAFLAGAGADGDLPEMPGAREKVEQQLQDELDTAEAQVGAALDAAGPAIGRAVRQAVREAAANAEEDAVVGRQWGLSPGAAARMDPQDRLRLAARMKNDTVRMIAELLGRMQNVSWGDKQKKLVVEPDEVFGVTVGGDLTRLLPVEHAARRHRLLRMDFLYRLTQKRVLQYELKRVIHEGKGPLIYVEDSSSSMDYPPEKYVWSKAFGLNLLSIAKDQGRAFFGLCFTSGPYTEYAFPEPASFTTERMLDYAQHGASGGTEVQGPLDRALELIASDPLFRKADVVLSTDGEFDVDPVWLAGFKARQQELGFTLRGLAIGCDPTDEPFSTLCDGKAIAIQDLASGENVRELFGALR